MSSQPAVSVKTYVAIYLSLLCLTLLTVSISEFGHLGVWEIPVALGIAATKTTLVGLFFMHLIQSSRLTWLIVCAGILFFIIMIVLTFADYATRHWIPVSSPF